MIHDLSPSNINVDVHTHSCIKPDNHVTTNITIVSKTQEDEITNFLTH